MISAVVLAAGVSSRMGRVKLVLPVEGRPILETVLVTLRKAKVDEVVVVLGAGAAEIKKEVRFRGERVVFNPDYAEGMSSSLKLGLKKISPDSEAALVVLGDQPFLTSSTINRIVDGYLTTKAPVVVPVHGNIRGNPVLFDRSTFPAVMKVKGDVGAKSVVGAYGDMVLEVLSPDDGILIDIDTPSEYEWVSSRRRPATRKRTPGGGGL